MVLPSQGQNPWGTVLNADIAADETSIATLQSGLTNHEDNVPADPHGDRAYALGLTTPITTGTNQPNGYVVLTSAGKIPLSLVPVGAGLTNWIDAVPDFNVPVNGVADASATLNAALFTASTSGGVVYVGSGQFALASPLIIYPNTWLLCSPGAVFSRINLTTPPFSMIQNFAAGVVPQNGNIRITGGTWNIASLASSGCMFTFANADFLLIEDLGVIAYPDGHSPVGRLFGCADVTLDNIQISAAAPLTSGRGNQNLPCFQVDELNVTNLPGVPNSIYLSQECSDIRLRGCSHRVSVLSDSFGAYSAWTSFCGSKGTITSGNVHSNIVITECFGSGFAVAAVEVINWSNLTCTSNFFTYPKTAYVATWTGVSAQLTTFIFDVNTPRSYPPTTATVTVSASILETVLSQFTLPANDWIAGSTCYKSRHTGIVSTAGASVTFTLRIRVGTTGTISDTLVETIVVTLNSSITNVPYSIQHRGFDVDSAGHWNSHGLEFFCSQTTTVTETVSLSATSRFSPTAGVQLFVSHTVQWGTGSASNTVTSVAGVHERVNL
jgi:hypothetical protein